MIWTTFSSQMSASLRKLTPTHAEILANMDQNTLAELPSDDPRFVQEYARTKAHLSGKLMTSNAVRTRKIEALMHEIQVLRKRGRVLKKDGEISWTAATRYVLDKKSEYMKILKRCMESNRVLQRDQFKALIDKEYKGDEYLKGTLKGTLDRKFTCAIEEIERSLYCPTMALQRELQIIVLEELVQKSLHKDA